MNGKSVSIHTLTRGNRVNYLSKLVYMINKQDYDNITEWVIGDGSEDEKESEQLRNFLTTLDPKTLETKDIEIKFIHNIDHNKNIGEKREIINLNCEGDYIVCMDDDDYYPPTRVSHAVEKLEETGFPVAGVSSLYIFDIPTNSIYLTKKFHDYHATHNTLAYTKEYAHSNGYDKTRKTAEEKSFLHGFKTKMVQLDTLKTIVYMCHHSNTFNKRQWILNTFRMYRQSEAQKRFLHVWCENVKLDALIKDKYMVDYYKSLVDTSVFEEADIVYYTGGYCIKWDPSSLSLTGSEQAIKYLSQEWVKKGKKVVVYANIDSSVQINGVQYYPWTEFIFSRQYKTLILWRITGVVGPIQLNVKADTIIVDFHDTICMGSLLVTDFIKRKNIKKIMLKSFYHKEMFLKYIQKYCIYENVLIANQKIQVLMNGVCRDKFLSDSYKNIQRIITRFCYTSCYTRGLEYILTTVWPVLLKRLPNAELHCYYGLESIHDDEKRKKLENLLKKSKNVFDHGRQPQDKIIEEKYKSTFHLYWSDKYESETDCIAIKESLLAGCIPIISNQGVFKEREGIHIKHDTDVHKFADIIVYHALHNTKLKQLRNKYLNSNTLLSWENVAVLWPVFDCPIV